MMFRHYSFILVSGLIFVSILLAMATVNFIVDPAQLFHAGALEKKTSKALANGKFLEGLTKFDERLFHSYLLETYDVSRKTIVFGSSRSMLIQKKHFPKSTFFNHSVGGGTLEDYVAFTDVYIKRGLKPDKIILTLEPWLLNINNRRWRWASLRVNFFSMLDRLGVDITDTEYQELKFSKLSSLVSLKYFRNSILSIKRRGFSNAPVYQLRSDDNSPETVIRPDGSHKDPDWRLNRSTDIVTAEAIQFANANPIKFLDRYETLDLELRAVFESLVDYYQSQGIKVAFFLPPYHPVVYKTIQNNANYRMVSAAQRYYENFALKRGIKIFGSFNPGHTKCGIDEFIDAHHANQNCIDRILAPNNS